VWSFCFSVRQWSVVSGQWSGFRVQGSGFRVQGSGFRVQGSGFRVQGSGFSGRVVCHPFAESVWLVLACQATKRSADGRLSRCLQASRLPNSEPVPYDGLSRSFICAGVCRSAERLCGQRGLRTVTLRRLRILGFRRARRCPLAERAAKWDWGLKSRRRGPNGG
jgi:hypothetical protein